MKRKNRCLIFIVTRSGPSQTTVLDSFYSLARAEEMKGVYEQKMKEHNVSEFVFEVQSSVYYDE